MRDAQIIPYPKPKAPVPSAMTMLGELVEFADAIAPKRVLSAIFRHIRDVEAMTESGQDGTAELIIASRLLHREVFGFRRVPRDLSAPVERPDCMTPKPKGTA